MAQSGNSKLGKLAKSRLLLGIMIATSFTLISFEWKFSLADVLVMPTEDFEGLVAIMVPITVQEPTTKPIPKAEPKTDPTKITIVEELPPEPIVKKSIDEFPPIDGDSLIEEPWDEDSIPDDVPATIVTHLPYYKGCDYEDKGKKYKCTVKKIYQNLSDGPAKVSYPKHLREQGIEGRVSIKFVIDVDGSVVRAESLHEGRKAFEREAIKGVSNLPDFIPGEHMGKKVPVIFNLPVSFSISER